MDVDSSVISKIRSSGPILPIDVHKQLGLSVLFTSAHLSEMVRTKKVKITKFRKGGSPFYYLPEKPEDLEFLIKFLKPIEREAFEVIKSKRVLKDAAQNASVRSSLRILQDFAIPLYVTFDGRKELFWKYYLVEDSEVTPLIKELLGPSVKKPELKPIDKKHDVVRQEVKQLQPEKPKVERKKRVVQPKPLVQETIPQAVAQAQPVIQPAVQVVEIKPEPPVPTLAERIAAEQDSFFLSVKSFFDDKKIIIKDYSIIKKTSEADFFVEVPSAIGSSEFFCRAKNKKRVNEGDLSTAFVAGQIKKIPILFLSPGELTKRAQGMLDVEFKNQVFFKKL